MLTLLIEILVLPNKYLVFVLHYADAYGTLITQLVSQIEFLFFYSSLHTTNCKTYQDSSTH